MASAFASPRNFSYAADYATLSQNIRTQSVELLNKHLSMKTLRILVVEDDPMLGELLAEMLQTMGHEVCGVENTEADTVTAAFEHKPDLMIIDAWLRDGSGVSAVDKICAAGFISHFFISGDILRVKALRPGAVVVQKPFWEADLVHAIQRALKGSSA